MAEIESAASTAMLVAAARRRDARFSITASDASVVARVCRQLDGLLLALELASAGTGLLGIDELARFVR